ncbi:MAG TPA: YdeI/OmpD-associated family protein [Yeosuana sp.]
MFSLLDDVENGIIPNDIQIEFNKNHIAFNNYQNFATSYRKSYLYGLNQAKPEASRQKRITEIIQLCADNIKSRGAW